MAPVDLNSTLGWQNRRELTSKTCLLIGKHDDQLVGGGDPGQGPKGQGRDSNAEADQWFRKSSLLGWLYPVSDRKRSQEVSGAVETGD